MTYTLMEDVTAIILPAFDGIELSDECKRFLDQGGVSILLGENRQEYVARTMTQSRRDTETPATFHKVITDAKSHSDNLIVAVDQEINGICRLHDLAPQFPAAADLSSMAANEFEEIAHQVGLVAAGFGVNCFLAPVVDILSGVNPWLNGRIFSTDPQIVGRISSAFIRGVQKAGIAATAKHFPGFHNIALDPAIEVDAMVIEPKETYENGFIPFRQVIAANVEMMMVGPAITKAFDADKPALRSKTVVNILKDDLAFKGIVMADGLDAKATMRNDALEQVAIDSVNAGCDFLLLGDEDSQLFDITTALVDAANHGVISREALAVSAAKVRALGKKYQP